MDQPPERSWWSRNLLWIIPVGCFLPIVVCGGFIMLIVVLVFGAIKQSDVYRESLAAAASDAEVKALLGEPIEPGFLVSGRIQVSGTSGNADFAIPISGPHGSATLYVVAKKTTGQWEYSTFEVVAKDSGERIDLLSEREP